MKQPPQNIRQILQLLTASPQHLTSAQAAVRKWLLDQIDERDPQLRHQVREQAEHPSTLTRLEIRLEDWTDDPTFQAELEQQLDSIADRSIRRSKNVIENTDLEGSGNVQLGDTGNKPAASDVQEKNIIRGSKIRAGGDIRIGDSFSEAGQEKPIDPSADHRSAGSPWTTARELIAAGDTEAAIDLLITYLESIESPKTEEAYLQSSRWQRLQKEKRQGVLIPAEARAQEQALSDAVLTFITDLAKSQ